MNILRILFSKAKFQAIAPIVLTIIVGLAVNEGVFYWAAKRESRISSLAIEGLLQREQLLVNWYLLSQAMDDLERLGMIQCAFFRPEGGASDQPFLDHRKSPLCLRSLSIQPTVRMKMRIKSGDGNYWLTEYRAVLGPTYLFSLWVFRFFIVSLLLIYWFWKRGQDRHQEALISLRERHANHLQQIASQVAHDIRSPLAALDGTMSRTTQLPENDRIIIRTAVHRIKDIANNLIVQNRKLMKAKSSSVIGDGSPEIDISTQLLSSLIDPLITEKRMQFRSKIGIEIDGRLEVASYGLFAKIQPIEFKRVISNLVNNSVEALGDNGVVTLSLVSKSADKIQIKIQDNGNGIPPDILSKLGRRGETHGKSGGSGLGLYHARTSVEAWGGSLEIESEVHKGTEVILTLPRAVAPEWFVSELLLSPSTTVVILDDDSSIHGVWQGRFESLCVKESKIDVVHISTPNEFSSWVEESRDRASQALFLADYELLGHKQNGLDLIGNYNLGSQSILVTSRFEEKQILESCQRLKVRLIPKGMAGFVPIKIRAQLKKVDAILIDDDDLVHLTWKMVAQNKSKTFLGFHTPAEFLKTFLEFDRATPVYVDANLGDGIRGEEIAEQIHKLGFTRVYLATGYEPDQYSHCRFLTGVLGKEPPF